MKNQNSVSNIISQQDLTQGNIQPQVENATQITPQIEETAPGDINIPEANNSSVKSMERK